MQFMRFCRYFDIVAKYAFSQAPSCTNFCLQAPHRILGPGLALSARAPNVRACMHGTPTMDISFFN